MGYACPVCETPQADGEHLAHHLAITALTRGGEHEAWLEEHAEGWADSSPADLADVVTDHAAEAEYETVFEDTVHDHGRPDVDFDERMARDLGGQGGADRTGRHSAATAGRRQGAGPVDDHAAEVLEEARELTEQMVEGADGADGGDGTNGDAETGADAPAAAETDTDE